MGRITVRPTKHEYLTMEDFINGVDIDPSNILVITISPDGKYICTKPSRIKSVMDGLVDATRVLPSVTGLGVVSRLVLKELSSPDTVTAFINADTVGSMVYVTGLSKAVILVGCAVITKDVIKRVIGFIRTPEHERLHSDKLDKQILAESMVTLVSYYVIKFLS